MKALVSGATGFIGSRLTVFLRHNKYDLRFLSRNFQSEDTFECDLLTDSVPHDALSNIDTVFHLAGFAHDMRDTSEVKDLYYKLNVNATVQLANLAAKSGVKKFVFVSSVKAGGTSNLDKCADENDLSYFDDFYGETKREAELKLLEISKKSSMNVSIIRPSLVYGPKMKGNLRLMLVGIEKGWFPPLPETGNQRSMIHVDDLVRAILLVAENDHANGEIFIATDGNSYSSNQIYRAMSKSLDKSIKNWVVPNIFFISLAKIGNVVNKLLPFPFDSYSYQKLLGDECYSSKKIQTILGFKASRSLFKNSLDLF